MRISDWSSDVCSSDLPERPEDQSPAVIGDEQHAQHMEDGVTPLLPPLRALVFSEALMRQQDASKRHEEPRQERQQGRRRLTDVDAPNAEIAAEAAGQLSSHR